MNSIANPRETPQPTDTSSPDLDDMLTEALNLRFRRATRLRCTSRTRNPSTDARKMNSNIQKRHG